MRNKIYDRIFIDLKKNSNLFTYKNLSNFEIIPIFIRLLITRQMNPYLMYSSKMIVLFQYYFNNSFHTLIKINNDVLIKIGRRLGN